MRKWDDDDIKESGVADSPEVNTILLLAKIAIAVIGLALIGEGIYHLVI